MSGHKAEILPISCPSRAVLWRRLQLAKSLLSHRPCTASTRAAVLAALDGEHDVVVDPGGDRAG